MYYYLIYVVPYDFQELEKKLKCVLYDRYIFNYFIRDINEYHVIDISSDEDIYQYLTYVFPKYKIELLS